jgi:hypothetical protein
MPRSGTVRKVCSLFWIRTNTRFAYDSGAVEGKQKRLHPFGADAAARGEAHKLLMATPKGRGWASPVVAGSKPKSGSPFCFFFLQEKEDPYLPCCLCVGEA